MNGPDNVFLGFLVESGVKGAPPAKKKNHHRGKMFSPSQTHITKNY